MVKKYSLLILALGAGLLLSWLPGGAAGPTGWTVIAWNNLGMHCLDADFSTFAILPPYNTIQAQVIDATGRRVTDPTAVSLTYEAVADPSGSINRTSAGKTNFWTNVMNLFNFSLPADTGLVGKKMPGTANAPQPMGWDGTLQWWIAEGIPLTPYDDAGAKNTYPMMKVAARNPSGSITLDQHRASRIRRDGMQRLPLLRLCTRRETVRRLGLQRQRAARLPLQHPAAP